MTLHSISNARTRRSLLRAGAGMAAAIAMPSVARAQKLGPFKVFMVLHRSGAQADEGFRDHLINAGLDIEFIIRNIEGDRKLLPGIVQEIKRLKPDLVYTQSTQVSVEVAGRFRNWDPDKFVTDIPVVFSMVSDPVGSGLARTAEQPGRNVTGAIHVVSLDVQLKAMLSYMPVRRLGMIFTPNVDTQRDTFEGLKKLTDAAGIELFAEHPLNEKGEPRPELFPDMLDRIAAGRPDLVYVPPADFFSPHSDMLMGEMLKRRLPSFCGIEVQINSGGLMGLVSRFVNVGALAGYKAEQILLKQAKPENIPAEVLSRFSFIVNVKTARLLEKYPPMQILRYAQIIET